MHTPSPVLTLYGINNCDTVRKARQWLKQHQIQYSFHDYHEQGLPTTLLQHWIQQIGHDTLINKKSTTYRQMPESQKMALTLSTATELMLAYPTLIKRPVLQQQNGKINIGFSPEQYQQLFK